MNEGSFGAIIDFNPHNLLTCDVSIILAVKPERLPIEKLVIKETLFW